MYRGFHTRRDGVLGGRQTLSNNSPLKVSIVKQSDGMSYMKKRHRRLVLSGYSMYPHLRPGDIIVVTQASFSDITPGCILCMNGRDCTVVHRVIRVEPSGSETLVVCKGDNLPRPDEPVLISGDACWQISFVIRNGRFRTPRQGRISAFLCAHNLTAGMCMRRIKRIIQWVSSPANNLAAQLQQGKRHD